MTMYKCIIVDDDELDMLMAQTFVKKTACLELVNVFSQAEQAIEFCKHHTIDVAFLDIELPGMSGLELRKIIDKVPACVFISSHFESASESYLLDNTLDFIVKPYKFERFQIAINRILNYFELKTKADLYEESIGGDAFYIKSGTEKIKIKKHEVLYLEALKNYTIIWTNHKKFSVLKSFTDFLAEDFSENFIRIHRSFAVCKEKIISFSSQEVVLENHVKIPIGRSYKHLINIP